ncbi:MAG TPA: AraC family transcriptional regulator, partial [Ktedonobacteraceae bacterium]|nr:AraC family transcriptional regulator [Ktedonobacteraceae bacterium]
MQIASQTPYEDLTGYTTLDIHTRAIERVIQVMQSNLHEALTLEDLASVAYLSPYYFNRVFRRLTGIPPGEFLAALRLHTAQRLLLTTSLSVTDICFEVGYNSAGSFTSRFTRLVGLAPRLLRQQARECEPHGKKIAALSNAIRQIPSKNMLRGKVSAPANFQGVIYVGLFRKPIPQGKPVSCTCLLTPGSYLLNGIPNGVYYLLTAAFPRLNNPRAYLLA